MSRKVLARSFLVAAVLTAFALGRTWVTTSEDNAGTILTTSRNGAATIPALDALLIAILISVISLFLLPRLAQKLVFLLTAGVSGFALWKVASWSLDHTIGIGAVSAMMATLLSFALSILAIGSAQTPMGPRADRPDPWRDLDNGLDPTVDR